MKLFFQRKGNVRVLKAVVGGRWGLHLMTYKGHGLEENAVQNRKRERETRVRRVGRGKREGKGKK